jgi:hypothetical protein
VASITKPTEVLYFMRDPGLLNASRVERMVSSGLSAVKSSAELSLSMSGESSKRRSFFSIPPVHAAHSTALGSRWAALGAQTFNGLTFSVFLSPRSQGDGEASGNGAQLHLRTHGIHHKHCAGASKNG